MGQPDPVLPDAGQGAAGAPRKLEVFTIHLLPRRRCVENCPRTTLLIAVSRSFCRCERCVPIRVLNTPLHLMLVQPQRPCSASRSCC